MTRIWSKHGLIFEADGAPYLFVSDGSRVYGVPGMFAQIFDGFAATGDETEIAAFLAANGLSGGQPYVTDEPVRPFPLHAVSLAVAQKCNLGCLYCYARQGDFGGPARNMSETTALRTVESLIRGVGPGETVNIAFLGGEPLINRPVLRAATAYAVTLAAETGVRVGFSITTNGTLVNEDDARFFEEHGFAVTISLDGVAAAHDRQRPYKGGRGSYDRILANVRPLLERQRAMQVSARVTVTPGNLDLKETLDTFVDLGFHSVGFSPMLHAPSGDEEMQTADLVILLERMIECGKAFEEHTLAGRRYPFLNLITALKEIHKGTHRPYPCGAGAGYAGVSAEGGYFACHRFVDDDAGALGDLDRGLDFQARENWLKSRHVHAQSPCPRCWARYLCGGGCHHEVIHRGRPACDYIRGWLEYCLGAYVRLLAARPEFFGERSDEFANIAPG